MKKQKPFWIALLTLAGIAAVPSSKVQAAGFAAGDLIFAVRDVGTGGAANPDVYLFDLGTKLPGSSGVVATGLGADLTSVYGSGWGTNTNLQWSIFSYSTFKQGLNTEYIPVASEAQNPLGTQAPGFPGLTQLQLNTVGTDMKSVDSEGVGGSTAAGFSGFTTLGGAVVLNTDTNGYASFQPNPSQGVANSFTNLAPSTEATGFTGSALDMFTVSAASGSVYSGTFAVNSSGDVSFSAPVVGVPEPGRAALLGLGLMGLVLRRRRSAVVA